MTLTKLCKFAVDDFSLNKVREMSEDVEGEMSGRKKRSMKKRESRGKVNPLE
jgi:hypothetical protein